MTNSGWKAGALIGLLVGSFGVGYGWRDLAAGTLGSSPDVQRLLSPKRKPTPTQVFKATFNDILTNYYRKVDPVELKYAGMEGLMGSLGDPHTMFMEPVLADVFSQETKGTRNFVGVGARLAPDPLGAKVRTVFRDGPAEKAGLKNGDLITTVEGKQVAGKEIESIVSMIRGKEGTSVRLEVMRPKRATPVQLVIPRGTIIAPTAEGELLGDTGIGYITVSSFSEPTTEQFDKALNELMTVPGGLKGLIIDMRGNPGGLLQTAVEMLSRFCEDKVVVTMKARSGREESPRTFTNGSVGLKCPIVVLVNENSASAAEIFAGVLRDYKLATLVGEHTYGKASVQNVFNLVGGSGAKITVARYYLPGGEDISRRVDEDGQYISGGLPPDVKVPLDPKAVLGELESDNQLQKAVSIIQSKLAK